MGLAPVLPDRAIRSLEISSEARSVHQRRALEPGTQTAAQLGQPGEIACDETLFERLRALRKSLADERGVLPYIVFSDVALRQMARNYPRNAGEFRRISGVGDRKLTEFGKVFMDEIAAHLQSNPRQMFADDSFEPPAARPQPRGSKLTGTVLATLQLFRAGEPVEHLARKRGVTTGTVLGHLATAVEAGEKIDLRQFVNETDQRQIEDALARHEGVALSPVHQTLGGKFDYGIIRVVKAMKDQSSPACR